MYYSLGSDFGEIYRVLAMSFVREHFTPLSCNLDTIFHQNSRPIMNAYMNHVKSIRKRGENKIAHGENEINCRKCNQAQIDFKLPLQ